MGTIRHRLRCRRTTCESKAALAEWNERVAAVNSARDTRLNSNWPDKADPHSVISALNECAAAADAMARLYHPAHPRPRGFEDVLAWMRPWFERQKLPIPASIGDGFRTIAGALEQPNLLRQDRKALYDQPPYSPREKSELAAKRRLGRFVERRNSEEIKDKLAMSPTRASHPIIFVHQGARYTDLSRNMGNHRRRNVRLVVRKARMLLVER